VNFSKKICKNSKIPTGRLPLPVPSLMDANEVKKIHRSERVLYDSFGEKKRVWVDNLTE